MIAKSRIATAVLFAALAAPVLAADASQGAMTGDPNWPVVERVAPSIALQQAPSTPGATEIDPTLSPARSVSAGVALRQEPIVDDPLQGFSDAGARYAAARPTEGGPAAAQGTAAVACRCHHG